MRILNGLGRNKEISGYTGKKAFWAKRIRHISIGKARGNGVHGKAFDFLLQKGNHSARLVMKKYYRSLDQTHEAQQDFTAMKALKKLGLSVPPTVRLVEHSGEKYILMTDLTKFGDLQLKYGDQVLHARGIIPEIDLELAIGTKKANEIYDQLQRENAIAAKHGIQIGDGWEIIVNTKTKTARAFIIDTSLSLPRHSH